jgi:hypothetical protein
MKRKGKYYDEHTMICISYNNRDRLRKLGNFGESYDDVLTRIINLAEEKLND